MALTKRAQAVFLIEAIAKRPVLQLNNEIRLKEVNVSPNMQLKNLLTPNEISYVFRRVSGYNISNSELRLAQNGTVDSFVGMIENENIKPVCLSSRGIVGLHELEQTSDKLTRKIVDLHNYFQQFKR